MDSRHSFHGGDAVQTESYAFEAAILAATHEMNRSDFYYGGNRLEGTQAAGYSAAAAQIALNFDSSNSSDYPTDDDLQVLVSDIEEDGTDVAEMPASGQLGSGHPSGGAPCSTLLQHIGYRDGTQSTSRANIEREELESDPGVPREGMQFDKEEAAFNFYEQYGKQAGFCIKRGKIEYERSDKGQIKGKYFFCKEMPTQGTRKTCEAKIRCKVEGGKWRISKVVLEHSHGLAGHFAGDQEAVEDSPAARAPSAGEYEAEPTLFSNVGCSGVSRGTGRNPSMAQDLIDSFKSMQTEDSHFFYTVQLEAAQGMANFFWRDGQSMVDYEHFGDVLILDTRTTINIYNMICAAFWGLNHHRQRIIFGYAFLVDQGVDSFKWLLQSFLGAMRGKKPETIITEVSEEIAEALKVVLPGTFHRLPYWSILNSDRTDVNDLLSECIFNVQLPNEFDSKWNALLARCNPHEKKQFTSLYEMRKKWSLPFTKIVFSAGLLSIQNNEDSCPVFENLSWETSLPQIAHRCKMVAKHLRSREFEEDEFCETTAAVDLESRSPMEKQAKCLYTRPIFEMFQKELINSLSLAIRVSNDRETFELTEQDSKKIATVKVNRTDLTLACSCGKFKSVGILCFHVLKVYNYFNIFEIPSCYLSKRWMKSAKDRLPIDTPSANTVQDSGASSRREYMREALHVSHGHGFKKRERIPLRAWRMEETEGHSEGIDDDAVEP